MAADDQDPVCIQTDQYADLHSWVLQKLQRTFGLENTQINTRIPICEGMDDWPAWHYDSKGHARWPATRSSSWYFPADVADTMLSFVLPHHS
jgi:hypothetical protein